MLIAAVCGPWMRMPESLPGPCSTMRQLEFTPARTIALAMSLGVASGFATIGELMLTGCRPAQPTDTTASAVARMAIILRIGIFAPLGPVTGLPALAARAMIVRQNHCLT